MASYAPLAAQVPIGSGLPHLDGRIDALGDANGDAVIDKNDYTLSASDDEARNTYDACRLDASVGFDAVLSDLGLSNEFAAIGVVEGDMALTDPPLDMSTPQGTRRVLRGSGGLRLYLVHKGTNESETFKFSNWGSETRTFQPREGCMQTADNLAAYASANHPQYAQLANLFVDANGPAQLSVRRVRAFKNAAGYPRLFVTCSMLHQASNYSNAGTPGNTDYDYSILARRSRLFEWSSTAKKFVDITATAIPASSNPQWGLNSGGLAVADLNRDGRTDIVIGRYGDFWHGAKNVILLQDASGNFQEILSAYDPFLSITDPTADIEVADIDGDNKKDIVVANRWRDSETASAHPQVMSQNYILWGTGRVVVSGSPDQPTYTAPQYLNDTSGQPAQDDTVALDVADVDSPPDGKLDLVFGNHGRPGTVFIDDNVDPNSPCNPGPVNSDLFYHQDPANPRTFTAYALPGSGGLGQLTTDIVFRDVAKPNRVPYGQPGWPWDFDLATAVQDTSTSTPTWHAGTTRDGLPEIVRVFRGRGTQGIRFFVNDPARSFDKYYDSSNQLTDQYTDATGVVRTIVPGSSANYAWNFLALGSGPTFGPWGMWGHGQAPLYPPMSGMVLAGISNYQWLTDGGFIQYPQVLVFGDFVPDGPTTNPLYSGWPSTSGFPDLFVGMGYELAGVNNRMYPFTSSQRVNRVIGVEFPGNWHAGEAIYTADWMEFSSHGYGMTLIDSDNDGDLDAIDAKRTALYLYENRGSAATPALEGVLKRVTGKNAAGELKWPIVEVPYAHSKLFTEDTVVGDFDEDGDLDVFTVGQGGQSDYSVTPPITRGDLNDEDTSNQGWLRKPLVPTNERMFKATSFLENVTVSASPSAGTFAQRSDRLDFNGRDDLARGSDRILVGDFDNDGKLDAFEAGWLTEGDGETGFTLPSTDPTAGMWAYTATAAPDYDNIARYKFIGYRYWHNVMPQNPSTVQTWFKDVATDPTGTDPWIYCVDSNNVKHFGPLDAKGGTDYHAGTSSGRLHRRIHLGLAAADFNRDGWLDVLTAYNTVEGLYGYNLFLNDGTGRLKDSTNLLPTYASTDVAGTTPTWSQGLCVFDYDNDGDVDIVISFFGGHKTALIENTMPTTGGALSFAARPYAYPTFSNGWVENEQSGFNGDPNDNDYMLWPVPIDLDRDGDQDLIVFSNSIGHRFFENKVIDSTSPALRFREASADVVPSCGSPFDRDAILDNTRITVHHGAGVGDAEAGDLNGDGWLDVAALYGHRPSNVYINKHGPVVQPIGQPTISNVFPQTGVRRREKFRIYGRLLDTLDHVDLLLANSTTVSIASTNITYPTGHNRYVDVTIPASVTAKGPARIRVVRNVSGTLVSSPVFGGTPFTILQ